MVDIRTGTKQRCFGIALFFEFSPKSVHWGLQSVWLWWMKQKNCTLYVVLTNILSCMVYNIIQRLQRGILVLNSFFPIKFGTVQDFSKMSQHPQCWWLCVWILKCLDNWHFPLSFKYHDKELDLKYLFSTHEWSWNGAEGKLNAFCVCVQNMDRLSTGKRNTWELSFVIPGK